MASGKRTSSETAGTAGARRRRPATTIDVTATEIGAAPQKPAQESPQAAREQPSARGPVPPKPEDNGLGQKAWFWLRDTHTWPYVAAGLAGGIFVSAVLFMLWLTGMVPIRYAGTTAMRARVAVLEMQLRDLQSHPAAADAKKLDELSQRLAKLEETAAAPRSAANDPALAERLGVVETAMQSLGIALTALNRRGDEVAANAAETKSNAAAASKAVADLDTLANRIAALEVATKNAGAPDTAGRLALATAALRGAVIRGEPFATEFATIKSLGGEVNLLAPLERFAASGVPSEAVLARELSALVPVLLKASGVNAPRESGFLDRLQASAGRLVRVRPAGETPGNEPAAVVARIEVKAAQTDISGALAELNKLPAPLRGLAEGWIAKIEARNAALDASRKIVTDTFGALGK